MEKFSLVDGEFLMEKFLKNGEDRLQKHNTLKKQRNPSDFT